MWRAVSIVVFVAVAGAGCRKPYQAEATLIGDGTYAIRAKRIGGAEHGIAHEYAMQRAREVCPGGFEVVDEDAAARRAWKKLRRVDTVEVSLVVRCGPPRGGGAAPVPDDEH
jgi:putative component of membrane protein insertase Oxa1/YidC/SpoIIIJ protein YidD